MAFLNYTPSNKLEEVEQDVSAAIARVTYFISPKIVRRIAELNCNWYAEFEKAYGVQIEMLDFFYDGSACVFPGVRRKASKNERELDRHKYHPTSKAILDVNWFPRELWCFVCAGKKFSAQLWKDSGLGRFELAHVLPHKMTEVSGVKAWFFKTPSNDPLHGLFCCASNVVLLPKGMARPTDGTAGIRMAVFKRYFELYGENHAGGFSGFSTPARISWYDKLEWNDPIEPPDWENRIAKLDEYRRQRISKLLAGEKSSK